MKVRNLKDVFVERGSKIEEFNEFLQPESKRRILNIHSFGDGGIGKTVLLAKMIESCENIPHLYYSSNFLDFHHTEMHVRLGIMRRISENLKDFGFENFNSKLKEHGKKELAAEDRRDYEAQMEDWFIDDLSIFAEQCDSEGKITVLFFDNYEKIQSENTVILQWFEELIMQRLPFPEVFRIVIAGRRKIALPGKPPQIKEMALEKFSYDEMVAYFGGCYTAKDLERKIGSDTLLKCLYDLVDGRPIFISLVVDWLEHGTNFSLMDLLANIGLDCFDSSKSKDIEITRFQKDDFKRALIEHIEKLSGHRDRAITYMAVAWRRMTPEMFSHITEVPLKDSIQARDFDLLKSEYSIYEKLFDLHFEKVKDCYHVVDFQGLTEKIGKIEPALKKRLEDEVEIGADSIFAELKNLSFIKYIDDVERPYLLHDEMRDLVDQYWWEKQTNEIEEKQKIAEALVNYYSAKLKKDDMSSTRWSSFYGERLYYALWVDMKNGLHNFFFPVFNELMQSFHINTCNLLFREIDVFTDRDYAKLKSWNNEITSEDRVKIELCRIKLFNERYRADKVLKVGERIERDRNLRDALQQKPDLYADYRLERGVANLWSSFYKPASDDFTQAVKQYRKLGKKIQSAWSRNWKGYALYRSGEFKSAEIIWQKTIKELLKMRDEEFSTKFIYLFGNLNTTLGLQGRFYEASRYGQIAVEIAKHMNDRRETIRSLSSLGDTFQHSNKPFQAMRAYKEADQILETLPARDALLETRVNMGYGALLYRHNDFIYTVEYYNRGEQFEEIMRRFRGEYTPGQRPTNVHSQARERYTLAKNRLEKAIEILAKSAEIPLTLETSMVHYYLAEHCTIALEWDKALEQYGKSLDIAVQISSEYRELSAMIGQLAIYYLTYDDLNFEKGIRNIEKRISQTDFWNLKGTLEILRGNYEYEHFLKFNDIRSFFNAFERYYIASDHMIHFGRVSQDRFYMTLLIMVKRMTDIPIEILPSGNDLESFRDIWRDMESERLVCQKYEEFFDDLLDFTIMRRVCMNDINKRQASVRQLKRKIGEYLNQGKRNLRFTPHLAMMKLRLQLDGGTLEEQAEAYSEMAKTLALNDIMLEAHLHYEKALGIVRENDELKNSILHLRILVDYGAIVYRRGEYANYIEHYNKAYIQDNVRLYKMHYKDAIERATTFFQTGEKILPSLSDEFLEETASAKSDLYFRWAELNMISGEPAGKTEELFQKAIEQAKLGGNTWGEIDAIQSLITLFYVSEQWDTRKEDRENLENKLEELNKKMRHSPLLMGLNEITQGNAAYEKILDEPRNKDHIEIAFKHYIKATRLKAAHSIKYFFQTMGTLIERIARLPDESLRILHDDVYPRLIQMKPTGSVAEDMFRLVEQYIWIRYKMAQKKSK